jgi:5-enolpyruvylshikimate-3-phosphate synthase
VEGEPQTVVPEETPMQRLIKALKQARAEKEARERAEALRIAEGSDAADKNIDAKSADSALVNASIERRCFNLINPEKFII